MQTDDLILSLTDKMLLIILFLYFNINNASKVSCLKMSYKSIYTDKEYEMFWRQYYKDYRITQLANEAN